MYQFTYGLLRKPMQLSVAGAALLSMKIISLVNALFWTSMTVLAIPTALFSITSLYIYTKVLKWLKLMPGHRNCFAAVLYRFFFGTWPSMSFFSRTESSRCHDCQHMPQLWPTGDILSTVDDSSAPQIKSEFRIDDDIKGDLCYFNNTDTDTDIGKLDEEKIDSSRGNNRNSNSRSNAFDFISLETLQASQPTPPHTRSKFVHLPGQGGKIRYLHYTNNTIRGEGKDVPATIVLVPSLFLPCDVLAPLCAFLSQTHDVLTFDFLGIGYSDAPKKRYDIVFHVEQLTAVLQHAGLMKGTQSAVNNRANSSKKSSVVLAGYSYGCAAASLFYALHHSPPQQRQKNRISVKELVMMNPTECYQSFDFLGFPKAMGGWGVKLALSHHFLRLLHVWPLRFGVTWLFGQLFRLLSDEFQLTHQDLMRQVRLMQSFLSRKHLVQLSPLPASPSSSSSASSLSILSSRDRSWAQSLSRALAPSMLLSPLSSSAAPTPLSSKRTQNPNTSDHSTRTTGKGNDRAAGQINEEHTCLHTGLLHRLRLLLVSVLFQNSLYDRSFSFYSIARARPCMLAELHSHLRRTKHNLAYLYETMEGQQRAERNERRDQNKQQQEEKEEGEENTNVYEEVEADRSGEPSPVKKRRTGEGRGKGGIERMDNAAKANIDDLASVSPRVLLLLGERSGFRPTNPGFIYSKTIQEYFSFTKQNTVPTSPTSPIEGVKVEMVVKDLKGCTHLMPLERPYETARAITTYLSTTSTTSPKIMMRGTKTKSAQVATNTKAVEPLATSNETGQSPRPAIGEAGSVSAANGSTSNLSREGAVSAWNEGTAASGDSRTHSRNRNRNCSHSNIDSPSSKHIHDDSLNLYDNLPSFDSQSFSVRLSDISTAPSLVSSESINSTTSPSSGANGVDGHGGDQSAMLRASLQSIAETNSGAAVSPSSTTMAFSSSLSHSSSLCWSPPSSPTEYEDTHSLNGSVASDSDSSMASPTHTPSKERKRKQKRAKHKSKYRAGLLRLSIEPELARIAGYCKSLDADDLEVEVLVDECRKQWLQIDSDHSGIITLDELKRAIWARDPANASLPVPDQLPVDLQFHVEEMKSIIGKANNIYLCDFFNWVLSVWDGRDDIRVPHRKLEFELDIDGGRRGSSSPGRLQNDRSARIHGIQYRADKHRSKKHHKRNVTMMV